MSTRIGAVEPSGARIAAWPWVALAAVVAHGASLGGGFTGDDHPAVVLNRLVAGPLDLHRIVTTNYWWGYDEQVDVLFRPATVLVQHLVHALGGGRAWVHHLVNVALHTLVSLEVAALGGALLGSVSAGAVAGALFAVHPLTSEAVNAVVGRADLLAALLGLEAFRQHRRAGLRGSVSSGLCLGLACLAKESALPLIAWMVLADLAARRRVGGRTVTRWAVLVAAVGVGLVLRVRAVGSIGHTSLPPFSDNPLFHWGRPAQLRTALALVSNAIRVFVFPIRLSADYSFDQIPQAVSWLEPRVLLGGAAVLALGALALDWRRPVLATAALLTALTYLPVSNLLVPMRTVTAERLLYLPAVGFAWLVAAGWQRWPGPRTTWLRTLGVLLLGLLAARSVVRTGDWRDDASLARATVAASPRSWRAHDMMASALASAGRSREAESEYREVLRINPRVTDASRALAGLLASRGALDEAAAVLHDATAVGPRDGATWLALARVESARGRDADALEAFARTFELAGNVPSVRIGRAEIALRRGDALGALRELAGLAAERPDRADEVLPVWIDALASLGRHDEALAAARGWNPRSPPASNARALRLERLEKAASPGVLASGPSLDPGAESALRPASRVDAGAAP